MLCVGVCALSLFVLDPQIGGSGRDGELRGGTLDTSQNGGVFEFTDISISGSLAVTGSNPVIMRSQGPVVISGRINLDGAFWRQSAGPGGYEGGFFATSFPWIAEDGKGPGGGPGANVSWPWRPRFYGGGAGSHATRGSQSTPGSESSGSTYGAAYPFDLQGGSGGGGGAVWELQTYGLQTGIFPEPGSGGGGAIAIFADGPITVTGQITVRGGDARFKAAHGGPGSGGAILLRSMQSVTIESSAQLLATGGWLEWEKLAGDGFIRIDAYGSLPDVRGTVDPPPTVLRLPELRELTPPVLGTTWQLSSASAPGDVIAFYVGLAPAYIPIPPHGVLELNLSQPIGLLGLAAVPLTGIDPLARLDLGLQPNPALVGLTVFVQATNHLYASSGLFQTSNSFVARFTL